jgi:hypothetical protein
MSRYLVVANQTLGGADLLREVEQRVLRGDAHFHVVVPMVEPQLEAVDWAPQDPAFGIPVRTAATTGAREEAQRRSEHRLQAMLASITSLGGQADGEVGPTDPVKAVSAVLGREAFDEVIVSTLPAGISRWLKLDLASRIARMSDVPVTTVEAGG